jgi:hypothetical protein
MILLENNTLKYAILMALYENIIDTFSTDGALFCLFCYQSQENILTKYVKYVTYFSKIC